MNRPFSEIAVIGFSARFPGAQNAAVFWENIKNGTVSLTLLTDEELQAHGASSDEIKDPNYIRSRGILDKAEFFDASFFGYSPNEAVFMDPQHRIFLEGAWEAFEHAGYNPHSFSFPVGVFAGCGMNTYIFSLIQTFENKDLETFYKLMLGNDKDFLPTRVSYKLNLKGPSVNVQSACSTSLLAIHQACQSLMAGECEMALAGGVSILPPQKKGFKATDIGGVFCREAQCYAFDQRASGMVAANGSGIVVLKKLEKAKKDGDTIYAVITGSAANNDGSQKAGFSAPSLEGEASAIREALNQAQVSSETIGFVEAHGTGTDLGDPLEVTALTKAFGPTEKKQFCYLGSVKANIGHTVAAAGAAGFIKTVLALKNKIIPPHPSFKEANPLIHFEKTPFRINTEPVLWDKNLHPRRAGVSSFGIGGTNVHIVLEEYIEENREIKNSDSFYFLPLSAKTETALDQSQKNLLQFLKNSESPIHDISYTLQTGRKNFSHRSFVVGKDKSEIIASLEKKDPEFFFQSSENSQKSLIFLFPGVGRYLNTGRDLFNNIPAFRESIQTCSLLFKKFIDLDLTTLLYGPEENFFANYEKLLRSTYGLPALFTLEYSIARLWMSWGIKPAALMGHSFGEYAAACISGVLSLENMIELVAFRGQIYEKVPKGDMLALLLSENETIPPLPPGLSLAAANSPVQFVISGTNSSLDSFEKELIKRKTRYQRLSLSYAAHSESVDVILEEFERFLKKFTFHKPKIPYVSSLTGSWARFEDIQKPSYWGRHLRETVLFSEGMNLLLKDERNIFLEVGPGRTLGSFLPRYPQKLKPHSVLYSLSPAADPERPDTFELARTLGKLGLWGINPDWEKFYSSEKRKRTALPTYPFESKFFWVGAEAFNKNQTLPSTHSYPKKPDSDFHSDSLEKELIKIWEEELGTSPIGLHDDFFNLGGSSLLAVVILAKVFERWETKVEIHKLISRPTISTLASLIRSSKKGTPDQAPILTLQDGKSEMNLFCIHPAGGSGFVYKDLPSYLDKDQSVHVLYSLAVDGLQKEFSSIQAMASFYLPFIRQKQNRGPYMILGASMGGSVAFEIAQQLRNEGENCELILLDSPAPGELPLPLKGDLQRAPHLLVSLFGLEDLPLEALSFQEQLRSVWKELIRLSHFPKNFSFESFEHFASLFMKHGEILTQYKPAFFDGRVTFLRAKEWGFISPEQAEFKWKKWSQSFTSYEVPGNHFTMLAKPNVEEISKHVQRILKTCPVG